MGAAPGPVNGRRRVPRKQVGATLQRELGDGRQDLGHRRAGGAGEVVDGGRRRGEQSGEIEPLVVLRHPGLGRAVAPSFRGPGGRLGVQNPGHVAGVLHQGRALPQQIVAAARARVEGRTGHGEHLAALLAGEARGDQRAGLELRLHHDDPQRQAGDDPVAAGKVLGAGVVADGPLGDDAALARQSFVQGDVLRRKGVVDPARHHRDRAAGRANPHGPRRRSPAPGRRRPHSRRRPDPRPAGARTSGRPPRRSAPRRWPRRAGAAVRPRPAPRTAAGTDRRRRAAWDKRPRPWRSVARPAPRPPRAPPPPRPARGRSRRRGSAGRGRRAPPIR